MLPQAVLLYNDYPIKSVSLGDRVLKLRRVPQSFHERDHPWISRYIDEFMRFKGKRRRELIEHFQGKLSFDFPKKKGDLIFYLLQMMTNEKRSLRAGGGARKIRSELFFDAAIHPMKPSAQEILEKIAKQYSLPTNQVLEAAFADLPLERKLEHLPENLNSVAIALRANLALVQGLISRSSIVEVEASGDIRRIVRQVKLRRLICEVRVKQTSDGRKNSVLCISGPLSIFGHTTMYGRALSELIPLLCWCDRFILSAACRVRGKDALVEIKSSDLVLPSKEPVKYDSKIEARFAKDFLAKSLDWNLIREPEAFVLNDGSSFIFPDFKIEHRRDPKVHFFLEIVGFWTPEYLIRKIAHLKQAGIKNIILCVDETLGCGDPHTDKELAAVGQVLRYRNKIQVEEVLRLIVNCAVNANSIF